MEESSFNVSAARERVNGAGFELKPQVFNVRGKRVVLDREVAAYVGMPTGRLNEVFRRNKQIFSDEMIFQLTNEEFCGLKTQIAFSNIATRGGSRHLPLVYSAEGVSMLEKVLKRSIPIEFEDEPPLPAIYGESWSEGTVVLYKPNDTTDVDVYIYKETAWLRQEQISKLFGVKQPIISKHLSNIFQSGELEKNSVYSILEYTARDGKTYYTAFYNLDAVLSVGYRVNSINATKFRQWANRVNALPPTEQIFMQGQFFDAYKLFSDLIRSAKERVIIIDNYVDESVLKMLSKHAEGVTGIIYTSEKCYRNETFKLDLQRFNAQYPPIEVYPMSKVHDRFMVIDNTLYSSGGSFKDAGKKIFSFEKMQENPEVVLNIVRNV